MVQPVSALEERWRLLTPKIHNVNMCVSEKYALAVRVQASGHGCQWDTRLHSPVGYKFGLFQQCPEVGFGSDVFVSDVLFKLPLFFLQGWEKVRLKGEPDRL